MSTPSNVREVNCFGKNVMDPKKGGAVPKKMGEFCNCEFC